MDQFEKHVYISLAKNMLVHGVITINCIKSLTEPTWGCERSSVLIQHKKDRKRNLHIFFLFSEVLFYCLMRVNAFIEFS